MQERDTNLNPRCLESMASIQVCQNSNKSPIFILNFDNSANRNSTWLTSDLFFVWLATAVQCKKSFDNLNARQSRIDPCLVTLNRNIKRFPVDAFGCCVTPKPLLFPFCLQVCVKLASSRSQPYLVQFRNLKKSLKNCEITHCWCLL